jgi:hypothetical protein
MPKISLRLIFRIIALISWLVSIIGLSSKPGVGALSAFLGGLVALIGSFVVSDAPISITLEKAKSAREKRNRQAMLKLVNDTWIKGVLEQSLHGAVLIALGLEERKDAVEIPWDKVLQTPNQPDCLLPPNTKIVNVFDEMEQKMLILGEPGSGKTTMLLELTRDTIARAEKDSNEPIPVVFNLSSWTDSKQSIADWLVEELNTKYRIPKKIALSWIENDMLLLLLDGLDEVARERREKCVEAINTFQKEHLVPLVVCSRVADYDALDIQLKLQSAVLLQPLTSQQVNDYLNRAGLEFAAVREALKKDPMLQELAQSPLMLSIMTLAYRGISVEDLQPLGTTADRHKHLFDTYVQQMFKRRGADKRYSPEKTIHWLSWLAQKMSQHAQSVFLIERMQPSWLQTSAQRLLYAFSVGVLVVLLFGLPFVLLFGLQGELFFGMFVGMLAGLFFGMFVGHFNYSRDIKTFEVLKWRWKRGMLVGLFFGVLVVLLFGLPSLLEYGLDEQQLDVLPFGLLVGVFFGLLFGVESEEIQTKTVPNQGIRESAKNAVIFGPLFGLPVGLLVGLLWRLQDGLFWGLLVGLLVGVFFGLGLGGLAFIEHYSLRVIIYRSGYIPWNYARFLDYAAERIFLRKVGGGYIFVHRLLMDYFASLEPEQEGG